MNILIFNWRDSKNPKSGGAEIVTLEHAMAWVKNGHKVIWFTSSFKGAKKEEEISGVKIVRRGNFITVYLFAPFFYLFSGNKFDLVIDEIHGLPFFTPLYVKKPKIAFIHEVAREIWDYMYPFPVNLIGKFTEPFYFKLYKNIKFWTDAKSTIDELVGFGIKRQNCIAISCAISNKVLEKLPQKEKKPTFVFVSRLVKMKGVEDVIDSFAIIRKTMSDSLLCIVGGGDKTYKNYLKHKVSKMRLKSSVRFFGYVAENKKLELMRRSHLMLHSSIKEGWGLVIVEAASQATPAVVYNATGLRDSVLDGKTGIVLSENSSREMAKEALNLINDKSTYLTYQKNGLEWARSLTWKKATGKSLKLISEAVGEFSVG